MQFGWNLLWFIIGVSLLVTVHEFGHFWVARKLGFKVLRFSVGFGKPLFTRIGKSPDHTEYVLAALPFGGYVRLVDERDGPVSAGDLPRAYQAKHPWRRIVMLLAGPGANFIFAIVVLWGLAWSVGVMHVKAQVDKVVIGSVADKAGLRAGDEIVSVNGRAVFDQVDASIGLLDAVSDEGKAALSVRDRNGADRTVTLDVPDAVERHRLTEPDQLYDGLGFQLWSRSAAAVIGEVLPGGPAAKAGLLAGDVVESVDGTPIHSFNEFSDYVTTRPDTTLSIGILRGSERLTRTAHTVRDTDHGRVVGRLQIHSSPGALAPIPEGMLVRAEVGPVSALRYSLDRAWQLTAAQSTFFARMLTGKLSFKNLSSPIGIAGAAGDSARAGFEPFLMFLVLISLSLGFLNLLPIPILDGGQIVFALTEWLKGSPLSERAQAVSWHAGLLMLVLLMGVAVFNDLSSRFG